MNLQQIYVVGHEEGAQLLPERTNSITQLPQATVPLTLTIPTVFILTTSCAPLSDLA